MMTARKNALETSNSAVHDTRVTGRSEAAGRPGWQPPAAVLKRPFPTWHYAMLNDHARNAAIAAAIRDLDLKGRTVVEIGAGSGIIAILFARAGAQRVIACEMNPAMAQVAIETIHRAGMAERIALLPMSSTMAIDQGLLPEEPDVIFTETVDCGVIGEGFHAIARDVRRTAGPKTVMLPREIRQYGMLIHSPAIFGLNHVDSVFGVDMAPLNAFSTRTYFPVRAAWHGFEPLTRPALLRTYDYLREMPAAPVRVRATVSGLAHGVLSWFELQMGRHVITNAVGEHSHWHQAFHPFPKPLKVQEGQEVEIVIDDAGMAHAQVIMP